MTGLLITSLVVLIFIVLYQVGQTSELSTILKEEERTNKSRNTWMAWSFLAMFVVLMGFFYIVHVKMLPQMLPASASDHGIEYDSMFKYTLWVTGIVFVITQFALFYFSFKYRASDRRTPFFFAHSNKLEIIWTVIPAIAMTVLVVIGLKNWFNMTGAPPPVHQTVEVIGKQFNWMMHYPGPDGRLGKKDFKLINDADNILGLDWTDPFAKDDIISGGELHLAKGMPVELAIGSRDVIHDVGLPHFRMKMDAVPGVRTSIWFTPIITTDSMKQITKNPNFVYELSCDQMCGSGHYSMRGTVIVHEPADLAKWLGAQKSYYSLNNKEGMAEAAAIEAAAKVATAKTPVPMPITANDTTKKP
jgi:cytochrome c oxidase subunit II